MSRIFRISLGFPVCSGGKKFPQRIDNEICKNLIGKLEQVKTKILEELKFEPHEWTELSSVDGVRVEWNFFIEREVEGSLLVVVQAFYRTLKFPNYFSLSGVGRVLAGGVRLNSDGSSSPIKDEEIYEFI